MKTIPTPQLTAQLTGFLAQYFPADAVKDCVEVILYAEQRKKTGQGLLKLMGSEALQSVQREAPIEITERSKLSATLHGHKNPSFHVAQTATRLCLEKARTEGFAVVGAHGIYSSTGALGFYAEKIAEAGMIGFCCARSPGAMAPFGTHVPLFGTNPFAWAFPTLKEPVVFDMATSAITFYELILAKMRGEKIPADVAVDATGALTDDPSKAMEGGILPFDKAYKGSALSMMVEVLSGPLVGASHCDYQTFDKDWGFFVFALHPRILTDEKVFLAAASDLVDTIRRHGGTVPGDRGRKNAVQTQADGVIAVEDQVAALLGL